MIDSKLSVAIATDDAGVRERRPEVILLDFVFLVAPETGQFDRHAVLVSRYLSCEL